MVGFGVLRSVVCGIVDFSGVFLFCGVAVLWIFARVVVLVWILVIYFGFCGFGLGGCRWRVLRLFSILDFG